VCAPYSPKVQKAQRCRQLAGGLPVRAFIIEGDRGPIQKRAATSPDARNFRKGWGQGRKGRTRLRCVAHISTAREAGATHERRLRPAAIGKRGGPSHSARFPSRPRPLLFPGGAAMSKDYKAGMRRLHRVGGSA
jgi:hypothetical protein